MSDPLHTPPPTPQYEEALRRIDFARRSNAETINLTHLHLVDLPAELFGLSRLRQLRLGFNALSSIPERISELRDLRILQLAYNEIKRLPDGLGSLAKLQ